MTPPGAGDRARTYLVTGAFGLVGANLTRLLLDSRPSCRVIAVDRDAPDALVERFLSEHRDRLQVVRADVTDPAALGEIIDVDVAIHGATVTHVPAWELSTPRRFVDTNIVGTTNVLEWARALPGLARLIYISTGGVYGNQTPASSVSPQSEDGPLAPHTLYAISKLASELLVRRYGELFGFDQRVVRLSGVFGPLERPGRSRTGMSSVYSVAHAAVAGRPLRVTARTLESAGDHVAAEDVADGIARLADADGLAHDTYNLASGVLASFGELLRAAAEAGIPLESPLAEPDDADLDIDPGQQRARWNAYDITRARSDLGWQPRPLAEQLARYADWLRGGATA